MFFSQVFTSRSFTLALQYLRGVLCCFRFCLRGFNLLLFIIKRKHWQTLNLQQLKKQKKCNFVSFKTFCQCHFLPLLKGYLKTHFEFSFGTNINFTYSNSYLQLIQKMSETDPGPLPLSTSKMELAVTIINGSLIYAKSPVLVRRLRDLSWHPHYCYPVKSPTLEIILISLLYLLSF